MTQLRIFLLFCCFLAAGPAARAQAAQLPSKAAADTFRMPPMNQYNAVGQRDGLWWISQPARMGEPSYTEFGSYAAGRKQGLWCRMDGHGLITAMEHYRKDVIDGEAKYFEDGRLVSVGHFRGLNPDQRYDTVAVVDPITGESELVAVPSERGSLRHGNWRYYDAATGQLESEEEWQIGNLLSQKNYRPAVVRDSSTVRAFNRRVAEDANRSRPPARGRRSLTR